MNSSPEQYSVSLADHRFDPPRSVSALMMRSFPSDRLDEVESAWSPVRQELAKKMELEGEPLEHEHWDWTRKKERVARGDTVLSAVICEAAVQGLIGMAARPREAALASGQDALYVEAAPWNLGSGGSSPRYSGVGTLLLIEAIALSQTNHLGGRVGLHSLPQAEDFYESRKMNRLGPDPSYYDLVYFEYDEAIALELLSKSRSLR